MKRKPGRIVFDDIPGSLISWNVRAPSTGSRVNTPSGELADLWYFRWPVHRWIHLNRKVKTS